MQDDEQAPKLRALSYIARRIGRAKDLHRLKREVSALFGVKLLKNREILEFCKTAEGDKGMGKESSLRRESLKKRAVRTLSGVAPVAVLTMPYACPGKCAFCPSEKNIPKSYLSNEPAVMRAVRCGFNPYLQVTSRIKALESNGHRPEKIELIVIGGTWSFLPKKYKYWFIKECFRAANEYGKKARSGNLKQGYPETEKLLSKEQKRNEAAKYRIIGITLETRPDYIDAKEIVQMRELGCTRVELGVQAVDDGVLKQNRRGHGVDRVAEATRMLKDSGFKITYHMMPGLPGSTPKKDIEMFKSLFTDENFQPDQIKFYPTVVTKGSLLFKWWKQGKYKPYPAKALEALILECKALVPEYVRIIRLIRDIPEESIVAGNRTTNLRQILKRKGASCRCIRCREVKDRQSVSNELVPTIRKYSASGGTEYFISIENKSKTILYGFCRLRIPGPPGQKAISGLDGAALVRELHVYGLLAAAGTSGTVQHTGLGKKLMAEAEKIALENGFKKLAVISGIGVRNYYRKLGYRLSGSYMLKRLSRS